MRIVIRHIDVAAGVHRHTLRSIKPRDAPRSVGWVDGQRPPRELAPVRPRVRGFPDAVAVKARVHGGGGVGADGQIGRRRPGELVEEGVATVGRAVDALAVSVAGVRQPRLGGYTVRGDVDGRGVGGLIAMSAM